MKCRKNIKKLIIEYNNASAAQKPNTTLMKLKNAILALKTAPSRLSPVQVSRYDDYVYIHQQSMAGHSGTGPHPAHRGPMFFPWHRELLRQFEIDLQIVSGDANLTLPYWNWTKEQTAANTGFPFIDDFLGGDGQNLGPGNTSIHNYEVLTGQFTAGSWHLNVENPDSLGNRPGFLTRQFGISTRRPSDDPHFPLPTSTNVRNALGITTYDGSPWNSVNTLTTFRNVIEGWSGPSAIHNSVHLWTGGTMLPATSPNDPIFFLHHNNIDRLWAVWMQKNPTVQHYLPLDAEPLPAGVPAHHFVRLNEEMEDLTDYFGTPVRPNGLLNHKSITWYDSDLPDLTNETGATLSFGDIPEGLTTFKAIKFRIQTCREVRFRITDSPTGNFGLANGQTVFITNPDENEDFVYGYVFVQFHAVGATTQNSAVTIQPFIIDEEGYYASTEGGEFNIGSSITVSLRANKIPRANNSIALVLDRSGSMADSAGGTSTKSSLLKNAVGVFHALMLPNDEICVVSFDDVTEILLPITPQSNGLGTVLSGTGLDPRNTTGIGLGIQTGVTVLNTGTHSNKAMLVLTDGNENVHPFINELPVGTINNKTYAIGFGLPGDVSDTVLNQITQNTQGDLVVTGNITSDEQRFHLTKYFVQILAGITKTNTILDPQGSLFWGSEHKIPFSVSETDISIDVIALCPLPIILDFKLETPLGEIIVPQMASIEPNISFTSGKDVAFYRLLLPTLTKSPDGSHKGKWCAILKIKDEKEIKELLYKQRSGTKLLQAFLEKSLPYSLIVQTFSNLNLSATTHQVSFKPNSEVKILANLTEYNIPFKGNATVWADITKPDQTTLRLPLKAIEKGSWNSSFNTDISGIYQIRIYASGITSGGSNFTREKSLTASSYLGEDKKPNSDIIDWFEEHDKKLCNFIKCILSDKVITEQGQKRLYDLGIDVKQLKECFSEICHKNQHISMEKQLDLKTLSPEFTKLFEKLSEQIVLGDTFGFAEEPKPVKVEQRKARKPNNDIHLNPYLPIDVEKRKKK
jgi:hypothetical protein